MVRLSALISSLLLLGAAAPAPAQAPAPAEPQSSRVFCEQTVTYRLVKKTETPERFRRFVGVWSDAAWDARSCAALIVEDVHPDATASIIYVYGPLGSNAAGPGRVLHGTGVIRNGELLFQNSDGSQFAFRPGIVDLEGRLTTPKGQSFTATFKQTP